jgi:biopolymer transport protein ExbB/TolQ
MRSSGQTLGCDILPGMVDGATSSDGTDARLPAAGQDELNCPHCGQANPTQVETRSIVDCRHCDRSFAQPRPPRFPRDARHGTTTIARHTRSPTDVGLPRTGAIAGGLTLLFYAALVIPFSGSYIADLFGQRGWVPYAITWLSAWAAVLLVVKAQLLRGQQRALELDLLPDAIAARITPRNAPDFHAHLQDVVLAQRPPPRFAAALVSQASRNFLLERLANALERFRLRGSAPDLVEHLASQSQLDANAVASSYTMIRVFIWAIPLLGFIGTVIGISASVSGFSDSVAAAVDLDVMKQSIASVTTGLGVAFDTTLLALVMSILIMFPSSSLQKAEEDFLNRVEAYCDERLGRRLDDKKTAATHESEELRSQISRLTQTLETLNTKLTRSD